ncbi:hypothetical protein SAMN02745135_02000 [Caloranaerobacter azorensis DSM 13643]|uniref:Uncharacterized protein n=1 Tax=Caloranaerobacter azorensis DSM 13643 TaxID=1121264 RepID=A0A1M5VLP4_9FIRM|nr:hypothetical protein [Caloranaerobacter azorensis]SHH76159.1 hypothetical protein SAMN02745135_02000 [Caloranaerobacter azorensis DSM 13643]
MKIIYDKNTKKVLYHTGTNLMFPEGPPNEALDLKENMATFSLHDTEDAEKVQQVLNAKEYELVFDENDKPVDVRIIQTLEEYLSSIPPTKEEINKQVISKIRERYDINAEFKMQRLGLQNPNDPKYQEYLQYVQECIAWGDAEKAKYGY